jgi:transposase
MVDSGWLRVDNRRIESVGASVINLSSYSPDFNPIEHWWSQLKAFIKTFSPKTTQMVDVLIAVALNLINPMHLLPLVC